MEKENVDVELLYKVR